MAIEWPAIIAAAAVVSALIAIGAFTYAIRNARKQAEKFAAQTETLSAQTELLRKQLHGEVYDEAKVKDLHFLLPAKCQHEVEGFEQKDEEEISLDVLSLRGEVAVMFRRMIAKLQTKEGKETYPECKNIVGPVFGQLKSNLG